MRNKNNNKVSSNITSMLAFNDFNRYYIRAMLTHAIDGNKVLSVYRAKESMNERYESKILTISITILKILIHKPLDAFYQQVFYIILETLLNLLQNILLKVPLPDTIRNPSSLFGIQDVLD